jgi:DNA-directed RNA polymerase specialized sigma24 family protein
MNNLPPTMTEAEFVRVLEGVVSGLAHNFVFGFFDIDDIRQQAMVFGIEAMPRYNPERPLENFLYTHVRNRLINFRRDKYRRTDPPVPAVPHRGGRREHAGRPGLRPKYKKWRARNAAKANLMRPLDIAHIQDEHERNMRTESIVEDTAQTREMLRLIDERLPVELRSAYLRIRAGEHRQVTKQTRDRVEQAVREILKCPSTSAAG